MINGGIALAHAISLLLLNRMCIDIPRNIPYIVRVDKMESASPDNWQGAPVGDEISGAIQAKRPPDLREGV